MLGSTVKRGILFLISLALCLSLAACSKEPQAPEIHTTSVVRAGYSPIFEYGNFLYFARTGIYRYNTVTGELTSACLDPECEGDCSLHGGMSRIGALIDGKLYYFAFQSFTHDIYLACQDLISGKVTVLDTLNENELARQNTFVDGGYFYYYAGILKDGGDPKRPEDYESHLCRVPLEGGEREVLQSPIGIPHMIIDGKLLMAGTSVTLYDLETGIEKVVWSYTEHGYKSVSEFSYVDGKLYFIATVPDDKVEPMVCEYTGVNYAKSTYLISVDISTGEWAKVTDEAVEAYTVTDDRVYYYPTTLRYLKVPEDYERNPDGIRHSFFSDTLYSRKLDGSDLKTECTIGSLNTCYDFTVLDGKLYGSVSV